MRTALLMVLIGWVGGGTQAVAEVDPARAERYQVIIDRNPFGLKDPPPPPIITNTAPTTPSNIKFSGITRDKGGRKAWIVLTPTGKPPQYISMREGDTQGEIQVLSIDEKEGAVEVLQAASKIKLTFATHGFAAGKTAPPNPTPGQPGQPGVPNPANPMAAGAAPAMNGPTIVGRGGVVNQLNSGNAPAAMGSLPNLTMDDRQQGGMNAATANTLRTVAGRPLRGQTSGNVSAGNLNNVPQVNPEVQAIMMQANRMEAQARGVELPPLPPLPGDSQPPIPGR